MVTNLFSKNARSDEETFTATLSWSVLFSEVALSILPGPDSP